MQAYIYQAALLCEECAHDVKQHLQKAYDHEWKSDVYPQGPYANGGGEADCPQHCDHCGVFLENPLTSDGMEYVKARVAIAQSTVSNHIPIAHHSIFSHPTPLFRSDVLETWARFYGIDTEEDSMDEMTERERAIAKAEGWDEVYVTDEPAEPTCDDCSKVLTEQVMLDPRTLIYEECYAKRTLEATMHKLLTEHGIARLLTALASACRAEGEGAISRNTDMPTFGKAVQSMCERNAKRLDACNNGDAQAFAETC